MSEADVTTMAALADGSTSYGATIRGAWATLQGRVKAVESQSTVALGAPGAITINWALGNHHKVTSASHNITSIATSGAPTAGTIRTGTLEVHNTGGTDLTVDATNLGANGLASVLTVPAGKARLMFITMTGTTET